MVDARVRRFKAFYSFETDDVFYGHMAELVDAPVSGTGGATHGSSSLLMPTTLRGTLRVAGHTSRNVSGGRPLSLRQAKP